jgi:hypothetical protein
MHRRVHTSTRLARRLFLGGMGLVYFIAFRSLRRQVRGLYGRRGILPVAEMLDGLRAPLGSRRARLRALPTVFWLGASDGALVAACRAGEAMGLALCAGVWPRPLLAALWALYLSFVSVGREFLSYQWDALLLESGLDALLVAPRGAWPKRWTRAPSPVDAALMRQLCFRLNFGSGWAKLRSGDPTWRRLTAMAYHHETTPLPTRLAWRAHRLPPSLARLCTAATLALECMLPYLCFADRRAARHLAFVLLGALQLGIAATGNYGFFNLLTLVDSLWLLETVEHKSEDTSWSLAPLELPLALVGARLWSPESRLPPSLWRVRALNPYGLFAWMTTTRPEVVIEGLGRDGTWREYCFVYKPGDPRRPPRRSAPHMPRLDWQMWFAALQGPRPWFMRLVQRLLEGAPEVLALLDGDPFPDGPPRALRALLYRYRMTDRAERRAHGTWWRRELLGQFLPPVVLQSSND